MLDSRSDCFGCWVVGWPGGTKPVPEPVWALGDYWTLNHKELGSADRPCWVMQSRRHLLDLSLATAEELGQFGPALAIATKTIMTVCEADRVYVQVTNKRGHYHLDLVPHYPGDPSMEAQGLANTPPPAGVLRRELPALLSLTWQTLQDVEPLDCKPL